MSMELFWSHLLNPWILTGDSSGDGHKDESAEEQKLLQIISWRIFNFKSTSSQQLCELIVLLATKLTEN